MFRLLGKSYKRGVSWGLTTLCGHTSTVMGATAVLVESLLADVAKQFQLSNEDAAMLKATTLKAAYLHDWGKANDHYQRMVYQSSEEGINSFYGKKRLPQAIRHEIISAIIALTIPEVKEWLERSPGDLTMAVWGAMSHHVKTREFPPKARDKADDRMIVYLGHKDFTSLLRMGHRLLGLPASIPKLSNLELNKSQLFGELAKLNRTFALLEPSDHYRIMAAIVKAFVIAGDIAGSAIPQEKEDYRSWIKQVLVDCVLSKSDIKEVLDTKLAGKELRPFQRAVGNSDRRVTVVMAGCGTGKTVAAYLWASHYAVGKKLFFCYPTTGTASQAFIDYFDSCDTEAILIHSRSDLDRELLSNGEKPEPSEQMDKLTSFETWRQKIVVCTVDTVLGLLQNYRRSLYAFPAIANAAFVFDEAHSYDNNLFGTLLGFLKYFHAPTLIMSASLSTAQIKAIKNEAGSIEVVKGQQELEQLKRYKICSVSQDSAWGNVEVHIKRQNGKVLWVVNSVQNCIDLYRDAKTRLWENILIYHSRFRYLDRVRKHQQLIEAFRSDRPVLVITTQVCEMSLDIDSTLLVSECASAAALIQRLGRLKRYLLSADENPGQALIYPSQTQRVYSPEELKSGSDLVDEFDGCVVSQDDLAKFMAEKVNQETPEPVEYHWFTDDWLARSYSLRDEGYTISVLLEDDMDTVKNAKQYGKSQANMSKKYAVPIRFSEESKAWKRFKFYPIAPSNAIYYSPETGAEPCKN